MNNDERDSDDDRPRISPAYGVAMSVREDGTATRYVCLACGFDDDGDA